MTTIGRIKIYKAAYIKWARKGKQTKEKHISNEVVLERFKVVSSKRLRHF